MLDGVDDRSNRPEMGRRDLVRSFLVLLAVVFAAGFLSGAGTLALLS